MAKLALITSIVVSVFVLAGCNPAGAGKAGAAIEAAKISEADLAGQLAVTRQAYRQGLETMIKYYIKVGNNMKLNWARSELNSLNAIQQYKYVAKTAADIGKAGPAPGPTVDVAKTSETDLAEQITIGRRAYRQSVKAMIKRYTETGDSKLKWAKNELNSLNAIPQYKYIAEATVAGANLKASRAIADADALYAKAVRIEESSQFLFLKDDNRLRQAMDKYNQLINKYPDSDKIDDAAYRVAKICEHFKDYTIAVLHYQRTYQWDPETIYPAKFEAAFLLDQRLHRRAEALQLYQEALSQITSARQHSQWQQYASQRVRELSGESKSGQ